MGNNITGVSLIMKLDNKILSEGKSLNGELNYNFTSNNYGTFLVCGNFKDNEVFRGKIFYSNLTVSNITEFNIIINVNDFNSYVGDSSKLEGLLKTNNGTLLLNTEVNIKLTRLSNNLSKVYSVKTNSLGKFSLEINLASGYYNADIIYNNNFSSANKIISMNISKYENILNITDFNFSYNLNKDLEGKIFTKSNVSIVNEPVFIKLTRLSNNLSKTYKVLSDAMGRFNLPINLANSRYMVYCSYDGTSIYEKTESKIFNLII